MNPLDQTEVYEFEMNETEIILIDTHAHLNLMGENPEEVIHECSAAGVRKIITVGINLDSCRDSIELAERFEGVYAALGVHPHEASSLNDKGVEELRELASHTKVVAIGETGLDFYRDLSPRSEQERAFESHIELSRELGLPLIIHDREAHVKTLEILRGAGLDREKMIMHCFSGGPAMALECMGLGCYISIAGPVTFLNAPRLHEVITEVPLEFLLLETDSPYLSPHPYRGKPNSPARLPLIAEAVARIKGTSLKEVAEKTSSNAIRLFNL